MSVRAKTKNPRKKVMDFGHGGNPHPQSTHGVDDFYPDYTQEDRKGTRGWRWVRKVQRGFKKIKDIRADYSKPLPVKSHSFAKVVSRYSLQETSSPSSYREAFRILEPGGIIEITSGEFDEKRLVLYAKRLRGAGFVNIRISNPIRKNEYGVGDRIIRARKPR